MQSLKVIVCLQTVSEKISTLRLSPVTDGQSNTDQYIASCFVFLSLKDYLCKGGREFHESTDSLYNTDQTEDADGKKRLENGHEEQGRPQYCQETDLSGADLEAMSETV